MRLPGVISSIQTIRCQGESGVAGLLDHASINTRLNAGQSRYVSNVLCGNKTCHCKGSAEPSIGKSIAVLCSKKAVCTARPMLGRDKGRDNTSSGFRRILAIMVLNAESEQPLSPARSATRCRFDMKTRTLWGYCDHDTLAKMATDANEPT